MLQIFKKLKFPTTLLIATGAATLILIPLLLGIFKSIAGDAAAEKNRSGKIIPENLEKGWDDPLITKTSAFGK